MYQKEYNSMAEQIRPDGALNKKVMETAIPRKRNVFRPAVAVALVLALVLAVVGFMGKNNAVTALNEANTTIETLNTEKADLAASVDTLTTENETLAAASEQLATATADLEALTTEKTTLETTVEVALTTTVMLLV